MSLGPFARQCNSPLIVHPQKKRGTQIPLFRYSEPGSKCEVLERTPSSADFLKSSIKHTIVRATVI